MQRGLRHGYMRPIPPHAVRRLALLGIVVGLTFATTITVAAFGGAFDRRTEPVAPCSAPALPGAVVDVTLIDMSMMSGGQQAWRQWHSGMMRVSASPATAAAGTISLRVRNVGQLTHELVVLPLTSEQTLGNRLVDEDGKIAEDGSLGEVSASCAAGAGDGIVSGATGWTTLILPTGRYELLCNLPGHYAAGMYTEITVT